MTTEVSVEVLPTIMLSDSPPRRPEARTSRISFAAPPSNDYVTDASFTRKLQQVALVQTDDGEQSSPPADEKIAKRRLPEKVVMRLGAVQVRRCYIETLDICRGELVALLGSSGAGKTTLLEVLAARRQTPYTGSVLLNLPVDGCELQGRITFVEQYPQASLLGGLTVRSTFENAISLAPPHAQGAFT
eukprot:3080421-Prymnesium_polylepis.2